MDKASQISSEVGELFKLTLKGSIDFMLIVNI